MAEPFVPNVRAPLFKTRTLARVTRRTAKHLIRCLALLQASVINEARSATILAHQSGLLVRWAEAVLTTLVLRRVFFFNGHTLIIPHKAANSHCFSRTVGAPRCPTSAPSGLNRTTSTLTPRDPQLRHHRLKRLAAAATT